MESDFRDPSWSLGGVQACRPDIKEPEAVSAQRRSLESTEQPPSLSQSVSETASLPSSRRRQPKGQSWWAWHGAEE